MSERLKNKVLRLLRGHSNKCGGCMFARPSAVDGVWECHRHPRTLSVEKEHWCGEFQLYGGDPHPSHQQVRNMWTRVDGNG